MFTGAAPFDLAGEVIEDTRQERRDKQEAGRERRIAAPTAAKATP